MNSIDSNKPDSAAEQMLEQLRQDNLAKQVALEAKSKLIDNMAYQIRTLSNAIIGFSDLLNAENLPESQREYVHEIYQAGKALSVLVNDVLDLAKLDAGKLVLSKTFCDLVGCLEDLYEIIVSSVNQKQLDFSIVADSNVPSRIFTDGQRLIKCLSNLVTNAVKYTTKGNVRITVSLQMAENSPWIRFDVQDTGRGIPDKKLAEIFDVITDTEDANRSILSSLDMGFSITVSLPVTKRLVDTLGGRIEVTSQIGQGSTFSILIPAGINIAAEKPLDLSKACWNIKQPPSTKPALRKTVAANPYCPRVLLVEDEESNRTVITLLLETLGLAVDTAEDGVQAIEQAMHDSFDVILMDLRLPNIDGYQAAKTLRQKNITTPIIALSAGVMSEQDSKNIQQDFNALLTKPVDGKKLQQTLRKFLPQWQNKPSEEQPEFDSENDLVIEYTNG